jgi:hypothetical protein
MEPASRHGAYVCIPPAGELRDAPVDALAGRLGLRNEHTVTDGHPPDAVAYLRRMGATPGDVEDAALLDAAVVVHVASASPQTVDAFCAELARLVPVTRVLGGVVRPPSFTGGAMYDFAYARQRTQEPAAAMPNGFLLPLSKTADWWAKDWMERHTYFLPRYDDAGRKCSDGHALAAAPGVAALMRRTYKHPDERAPLGAYDFVNYFECADADVPTFHAVCAALRDVDRNPEWAFVREAPTWQGRRVGAWRELFG